MTENLLDLSDKVKSPVVVVCEPIAALAEEHDIQCFVIGATARDVIMSRYYGIPERSVTKDVDFGIQVSSWNQFEKLKKRLLEKKFFREGDQPHKFFYKDTNIQVDIVPYGAIASKDNTISWPPENSTIMSVSGYEDAYACSIRVLLRESPHLEMRFASPVGLVVLKLIAWNDNPMLRKKDAEDILYILSWYLDLDNRERLVKDHEGLLDEDELNEVRIGARLLGRDISRLAQDSTKVQLREILSRETDSQSQLQLVRDMRAGSIREISDELRFDALTQLLLGLDE